MRRLPVYFVVDVSESMVGEPIEQVQNGMRQIIQELRMDPYALETAFVSVIAFAGKAELLSPLTELYKFYPPVFPIGGGTSLGTALDFLMKDIDQSVQKTTLEEKGDWKPIVFLFTDGTPTDDPTRAFDRWNAKYRKSCNLVAISIGDNVDTNMLGKISDNVLKLNSTDEMSFKAFFKWVTASIKTTSMSVSEYNSDEVKLAPVDGINLEKVDTSAPCKIDENFVVLIGRCQSTNKHYLIKYAKRVKPFQMEQNGVIMEYQDINVGYFKLVGAYPIDYEKYQSLSDGKPTNKKVSTRDLMGQPTCPCCGNQFGLVICECGNIFCVGENRRNKCPWCGLEGELGGVEGSMDINRTRG